ncbi:phage tail protein [Comamonas thiooxydans]|uniref:Phage tail protein n=1 Tax=Comamonas thiooxydans TaxID=363952 RepID=A0AA42Q7B5_9BURK|nr:phage tail protein [Comamonas thiooxydans]MDH1337616.1 phage tail protein [Comamonas thiooxydans]MDH1743816.1 phage tail protein [Comamonas thiooxydans]MDH1790112.1 phage tail protein [Comamonas thiooxydans]
MKKPQSLRNFIAGSIPELQIDPQRLKMFVESGNIVARSGETLSFEYRFTVRLIVLDYAGSLDLFAIPILAWLNTYQPDLLQNKDKAAKGLRFDVEVLANDKVDLVIEVDLSEAVIVKEDQDEQGRQRLTAEHKGEIYSPKPYATGDYTLYLGDKIGAEWHQTQGIE